MVLVVVELEVLGLLVKCRNDEDHLDGLMELRNMLRYI